MPEMRRNIIPVIDLFAGPGGLSEGFASFKTAGGQQPFNIALSIEKDVYAHRTLTLRSFFRQFELGVPDDYYEYLRKADQAKQERRTRLFDAFPKQAASALLAEMGSSLGGMRHAR